MTFRPRTRRELPGVQAKHGESGLEQASAWIPKLTVKERPKWQPLFFCEVCKLPAKPDTEL